jgi:hypothetical protein
MGGSMKAVVSVVLSGALGLAVAGCASSEHHEHAMAMAKAKESYVLKGDQVEGCECMSVCPCVFAHDVTFNDCRGIMAWHVKEGHYGSTDLAGINFAVVLTKSGKNVPKAMGTWEGVIYVSSNATADQKKAVVDVLSTNWGKAFSKVDVKSEAIDFSKSEGDKFEVRIGKSYTLKTEPLHGAGGKAPTIQHATFSLIPVLHCATTSVNTYDDGAGTKWDFKERNSFYGPYEYRGE